MSDAPGSRDRGKQPDTSDAPSARKDLAVAEWTTLAILVALVGTITWLWFRGPDHPPIITVEPQFDELRHEESGYYLPVIIRNDGDATVEDAVIVGELDTGEAPPETVELTIPFLSADEEVDGTFIFQSDPRQGDLTAGVASYKTP